MLLSSINRYNDSKKKYLDEYGINVHRAGQNEKSVTAGVNICLSNKKIITSLFL
jgi:hypothetical protein